MKSLLTKLPAGKPDTGRPIRGGSRRGFTLIELLVVIAIIAILAAMLLPALAAAKRKAYLTNCISNMKQTSLALQMYFNDFQDKIPPGKGSRNPPGPGVNYGLTFGQIPAYNGQAGANDLKWLPHYIFPYLGLPTPAVGSATYTVVKVFICPAYMNNWGGNIDQNGGPLTNPNSDDWASYEANSDAMGSYTLNLATGPNGNLLKAAYPESSPVGPFPFGKGSSDEEPLTLQQITSAGVSLSSLWSLADADEEGSTGLVKPGCAKTPVHLNIRSFSYFDGHAATETVQGTGAYDQ